MTNPCRYCENRTITCHSECNLYIEWKKEIEELNKRIRLEKQKERLAR